MAPSICWSARLTVAVLFLLALSEPVAAYDVLYCSAFNTAETPRNMSIYQSNSLCFNYCNGITDQQTTQYALAVVSYQGCWCTNYAPATTTTGCDLPCPGWPSELCGSSSPVLYGYVELPREVSGTRGPPSSSPPPPPPPPSSSPPPPPPPTSTSVSQAQASSSDVTTSSTSTTTSSSSSSSTTSSSSSSSTEVEPTTTTSTSSTWTPTPVTSLETITGQVRTVTLIPTTPPNPQATNDLAIQPDTGGHGGLGTGGAVGLTVGLVALVAMIAAAIFFFLRKRRLEQEALESLSRRGSSAGFGAAAVPSRTMSENSRYVLGTDGRRVVETWEPGEAEVAISRLVPVDQRLDPFSPVYQRGDNKSRESVNTIRDDHDYSRRMITGGGGGVLRATNPD